jgi:transposase-like protein
MPTIDERHSDQLIEQRSLTPEEKSEAVDLLDSGRSLTSVARQFRVQRDVLLRWSRERRREADGSRNASSAASVSASELERTPEARAVRERTDLIPRHHVPMVARGLDRVLIAPGRRPYVSPGRSALNHWRLVAACTIAAVVVALGVGLTRKPTYTAQADLVVGKTVQLNNLAAIPGLALAGQQIASDYSRLISTEIVVKDAQRQLHGPLGGTLSASPIAQSPIIQVSASAPSSAHAVALAGAGSTALVNAVNKLNEQQSQAAAELLQRYQQADQVLLNDTRNLQALQQQQAANPGNAAFVQQAVAAQTVVDSDKVKVDTLASDYSGTSTPSQLNEQLVQPVGHARATGSDRKTFLEIALLVAVVLGFAVGTGAGVVVDLRRRAHG